MAKKSVKPDSSKQPTSSNKWEVVKFEGEKSSHDMFSLLLDPVEDTMVIGVFADEDPGELEKLSKEEQKTLEECEAVIDRNQDAFKETALSFCIIRKQRLYREKFKTFEKYCQTRHGFGRKYGYRLAAAGQALSEMGPIGDKLLTNESAARELIKAPKEKRREVLEKAKAEAGDHPLTAAKISAAVKAVQDNEVEEDNEPAEESVLVRPDFHAPSDQPPLATHCEMLELVEKAYNIHSDTTRKQELEKVLHRLKRELTRYARLESLEAA